VEKIIFRYYAKVYLRKKKLIVKACDPRKLVQNEDLNLALRSTTNLDFGWSD